MAILLSLIKNDSEIKKEYPDIDISWYRQNLEFASRDISTKTLMYLFENGNEKNNDNEYNSAIKYGYEIANKALKKICTEVGLSKDKFCSYLFDKVLILRVLVPHDTDLNHYYEIMNSRGEQLEEHEILKAKCLEVLDDTDTYTFNRIWEACSNMEKYVQYEFSVDQRKDIFDENWNNFKCKNFDEIKSKINNTDKFGEQNILNLLSDETDYYKLLYVDKKKLNNNENPDRFNTVINFSNFLLHILKVQTKKDISLDDKSLMGSFEEHLLANKDKIKLFGYNLLKGKFLFDKYIIKREFTKGTDHWSLKCLKQNERGSYYINTFGNEDINEGENRDILMLLSMFHVSTPTLVYKHWLNAALKYVFDFEEKSIEAKDYKKYLEDLAKAFVFDRFLSNEPKNYFEIIYENNGISKNTTILKEKLDKGTGVENFIFNYLDYLLWEDYKKGKGNRIYFKDENEFGEIEDSKIEKFEYTFRSSVEHYYPQHPINGSFIAENWLNNFGNLCLIDSSKNSRLSNYMPTAKKEHYVKSKTIDSIKQRIMMEYDSWSTEYEDDNKIEIKRHSEKMKELLFAKFINP